MFTEAMNVDVNIPALYSPTQYVVLVHNITKQKWPKRTKIAHRCIRNEMNSVRISEAEQPIKLCKKH
jgi:hypothetical protein